MTDSHCHLNFHSFEKDFDVVIHEAIDAGLTRIINVGTKLDSSREAVELSKKYDRLFAIVGIHPHHADKLENDWIPQLEKLTKDRKVLAIGECGLDYYHYKSNGIVDPKIQQEVFVSQIELSERVGLPLQIHNRLAGDDVLPLLEARKSQLSETPGVFHCFQADLDILKRVLDLGFFVGFDGNITYPGLPPGETTRISDLARYAPVDRIVIETDSPFLSPVPLRGTRNSPKNVIITGEYIAKLKKIDPSIFFDQTEKNIETLFPKIKL